MATLNRNLRLRIDQRPHPHTKTKIVATIGPKTMSVEMITRLLEAGMNVARLNFSHGTHEYHGQVVANIRAALAQNPKLTCAIMLDTKGPEIRTGKLVDKKPVDLTLGQEIRVTTRIHEPGTKDEIAIDYQNMLHVIKPGGLILISDGLISLTILSVNLEQGFAVCRVNNTATLGETKNVHLPGAHVDLPAVSEKDIRDLEFGLEQSVDIVAASFIRKAEDIYQIRKILGSRGRNIQIIAKIENEEGVENYNSILEAADGIMVARGDLGVEVKMEKVFIAQKMMISRANAVGKPVITATQMLESMITNPRPTRAECTDVANAVLDGTDCVMLSGETANGAYPVEAVQIMSRICAEAEAVEASTDYTVLFKSLKEHTKHPISIAETVASYAVSSAIDLGADLIITVTETGLTSRLVAKYRPPIPVISITSWAHTTRLLLLTRAAEPMLVDSLLGTDTLIERALELAVERGWCHTGSRVVIVSGIMEGVPGKTNNLKILTVGESIRGIKV